MQTPSRLPARERLLDAADELFYEEGIISVGIDRVIERADVAKATLYSTFGSKEGLIRAYLERRVQRRKQLIGDRVGGQFASPRERLLAVYDVLGELVSDRHFRGCAFVNASAETPPGSVIEQVSDEYRAWLRDLFEQLARDAGARDPRALAQQLALLYDGATVAARMDRDPSAVTAARTMAAALLDAATA